MAGKETRGHVLPDALHDKLPLAFPAVSFADPAVVHMISNELLTPILPEQDQNQNQILQGESISEITIPPNFYEEDEGRDHEKTKDKGKEKDKDKDKDKTEAQSDAENSNDQLVQGQELCDVSILNAIENADIKEQTENLVNPEQSCNTESQISLGRRLSNMVRSTMLFSTFIAEAADGVVVPQTLSCLLEAFDEIVNDVPFQADSATQIEEIEIPRRMSVILPSLPSFFHDLKDYHILRMLALLPLQDKQNCRLVCHRWRKIVDSNLLKFQRILTRNSLRFLEAWKDTPLDKLIVCDVLDVSTQNLRKLEIFSCVKELQLESIRPGDYDAKEKFENPTIGEKNLVEILKLCRKLESLILNEKSLGNFGLEVLEKVDAAVTASGDENGNPPNKVYVGWKWTNDNIKENVSAVSSFLRKIIGDIDERLYTTDGAITESGETYSEVDSNSTGVSVDEISYLMDPAPPFPAFITLNSVNLLYLRKLVITLQPTRTTEKMGLIAFLHVLRFPSLRIFSLTVQEYLPDEALYRTIIKFISKHHYTLRHLTFINPILSSRIDTKPKMSYLTDLDKVKLKSFTVAWEKPIGLENYWADGHYLMRIQRRLCKLELHTTNISLVETVVSNNFRFLTKAFIDLSSDTRTKAFSPKHCDEDEFDCTCFTNCAKLKILSLSVGITVNVINASKIPDTIEILHWYARYTRDDIHWFSRFLVVAKAIYIYHDKDVPMDTWAPFNFNDFDNFIHLPCLEQLYLPRIQLQDPKVTRFCERHRKGLIQHRDLFFINRMHFELEENDFLSRKFNRLVRNACISTEDGDGNRDNIKVVIQTMASLL